MSNESEKNKGGQEGAESYEDLWDKAEAEDRGEKPDGDDKKEETTGGEDGKDGDPAASEDGDGKGGDGEGEGKEKGGERDPNHGSVESLTKALNDTKKFAAKLQDDIATLKRQIEESKKPGASEEEKKAAQTATTDLKTVVEKIYADYPELKEVFDPLLGKIGTLETALTQLDAKAKETDAKTAETEAQAKAKAKFDKEVKPHIVKVHADFDEIVLGEAYWTWADKQRPGLKYAATCSDDPEDIIHAITEFKKSSLYKEEIEKTKKEQQDGKEKKVNGLQGALRGGSSGAPRSAKQGEVDDYDAEWDRQEAQDRRNSRA